MGNDAYNVREACLVVALNILTGAMKPEQWRGLRRLDEDEEAVLGLLSEVRRVTENPLHTGFGKVEVNVIAGKVETAYHGFSHKRKDLVKTSPGT
jgi:hypothetical protein